MDMKRAAPILLLVLSFVILPAYAQEKESFWETDYDKALSLAQKTGRDLLVDFSGSDWCGWCIRLEKEVFSNKAFLKRASEDFVLVLLDFPRKKKVENAERNAEIRDQFNVSGYPTVLLLGKTGKPYARTGYREGGAEAYFKHLEEIKASVEKIRVLVTKVQEAAEPAREGALINLFSFFENLETLSYDNFAIGFPEIQGLADKALDLDPKNERGLKGKAAVFLLEAGSESEKMRKALVEVDPKNEKGYLEKLLQMDISSKMRADDPAGVVKILEDFIKEKTFQNKDLEVWARYIGALASFKGLGEKEKARSFLKGALALQPTDPQWPERIKKLLEEIEKEE